MEVELFVLEVDGGGLAKGLAVSVFLDSRPGRRFSGTIKRVDDLAKQRRKDVPVQYFTAIVALDKTDPEVMKPGQRVRAEIQVAESEGLVVPRQAVFSVDGHDVVFRREGDSFEPMTVKVGATTAGRVILESGVDSGDVLALTDPRSNNLAEASTHSETAQ